MIGSSILWKASQMNLLLYVMVVLVWGTTWIAIAIQSHYAAPLTAVFWRFAIAGVVLLLALVASGRLQRISWCDHVFCVLQSLCVFSLNFVCLYYAVADIHSGLESVIFSAAVFFNAINSWLFFKQKPNKGMIPAACVGLLGMVLLFWQELDVGVLQGRQWVGIALAVLGTFCFSLGNMVSVRHQHHGLDVFSTNAYAMCYGAVFLAALAWLHGDSLYLPTETAFLGSLLYLALVASIVGFGAYFVLIKRVGAAKSAYSTLLFPLVALAISTVWEGYQWHVTAVVGMVLILGGNFLMFYQPKTA